MQNYRNETNEAEDVGNHMMKKRTLKSNREKKERKSRVNLECTFLLLVIVTLDAHRYTFLVYHGSRGRYLYFQCQQLILRKQVAALTRLWKLPKEFEVSKLATHIGGTKTDYLVVDGVQRHLGSSSKLALRSSSVGTVLRA